MCAQFGKSQMKGLYDKILKGIKDDIVAGFMGD